MAFFNSAHCDSDPRTFRTFSTSLVTNGSGLNAGTHPKQQLS